MSAAQQIADAAARLFAAREGRMTLFVVRGMTGEYSDRDEWSVGVFLTRAAAEAHEKLCTDWAIANRLHRSVLADYPERIDLAATNPHDPDMKCDYTGTDYCAVELPLRVTNRFEAEAFADALMEMRAVLP
jgi:hypothetical protein